MKNIYIKDPDNCMLPVYVPGEKYSFYINFQNAINDPDFANFRLNVVVANTQVNASLNIGALKKHILENELYNIYCEFTFPPMANNTYYFEIVDVVKAVSKAKSNYILVENTAYNLTTQRIEYANELNIDKFYYETLPEFRNIFRLQLSKIDVQFPTEKNQYRNITDHKLRTISSYRDKVVKIESYYFDEDGHEAMASVVDHSEIYIDDQKYVAKTPYQTTTSITSNLYKGEFDAIEDPDAIIDSDPVGLLVLNQPPLMKVGANPNLTGTATLSKGIGTGYTFYMKDIQEPAQPQVSNIHDFGAYVYVVGDQQAKVVIAYILNDKNGQVTAVSSIEGVYPIFATTIDVQTKTEQPLLSMLKANNIQILLAAETDDDKQYFDIPSVWLASRPLVSIQYFVNHLGRFEELNKITDFTVSDVVDQVSGNDVNYKRYINNTVDRGSILIKLIF